MKKNLSRQDSENSCKTLQISSQNKVTRIYHTWSNFRTYPDEDMDKSNNNSKKGSLFAFLLTSANCEVIFYGFKAGCKIKALWIIESGSVLPPKSATSVHEAL